MNQLSIFGGAAMRVGPDRYVWADGTPEPRISDLSRSRAHNFRIIGGAIEIPRRCLSPDSIYYDRDLVALVDRCGSHRLRDVVLVPVSDWDSWDAEAPYGVIWRSEDEEDIIRLAIANGWSGHHADAAMAGERAPDPASAALR